MSDLNDRPRARSTDPLADRLLGNHTEVEDIILKRFRLRLEQAKLAHQVVEAAKELATLAETEIVPFHIKVAATKFRVALEQLEAFEVENGVA